MTKEKLATTKSQLGREKGEDSNNGEKERQYRRNIIDSENIVTSKFYCYSSFHGINISLRRSGVRKLHDNLGVSRGVRCWVIRPDVKVALIANKQETREEKRKEREVFGLSSCLFYFWPIAQ